MVTSGNGAGESFFHYFPLPAPNTPILPTLEYAGKSSTNAYGDFVLQYGGTLEAVMATLNDTGVSENTILIFSSDNGCSPRADYGERAGVGHKPSYIFHGYKADIYEGGHRITLLLRYPPRTPVGSVCDDVVCLSDLLATCADLVSSELPDEASVDSVSILPVWLGQPYTKPLREVTAHQLIDGSFSLRKKTWKLKCFRVPAAGAIPTWGGAAGSLPLQLYDRAADVAETRNVSGEHPDVVEELRTILTGYVKKSRSTSSAPQPNTGSRYWSQLNWLVESEI